MEDERRPTTVPDLPCRMVSQRRLGVAPLQVGPIAPRGKPEVARVRSLEDVIELGSVEEIADRGESVPRLTREPPQSSRSHPRRQPAYRDPTHLEVSPAAALVRRIEH